MKKGSEDGFVLVAAIWFVALLALVAVAVAAWIEHSLGEATTLSERIAARAHMIGAANEVAFLMTTGYWSARGLELGNAGTITHQLMPDTLAFAEATHSRFIALDNRPYRLGKVILRLQDNQGLLNLNYADRAFLGRVLSEYGVGEDERDTLIDRLRDYVGHSGLVHLNGADTTDYLQAGRPPPRHAPLLTPWEAYRVLGWNDYPRLWEARQPLPEIATVSRVVGLNPNTAPARVLRALPGMDKGTAQAVIRYRRRHLIFEESDLSAVSGVPFPIILGQFAFFPGDSLRVTLKAPKDPLAEVLSLTLTPGGPGPLRVDYAVALPQRSPRRPLGKMRALPTSKAIPVADLSGR